MRSNQRHKFFVFALTLLCALLGVFAASARQSQEPVRRKEPQQSAQQRDDEPVAITEKAKVEKSLEIRVVAEGEFGNFRSPVINNKGEIAFISLFSSSKIRSGVGQSIFVRGVDGSWKITRQGEKIGRAHV